MPPSSPLVKIATLRTPADFRAHVAALGISLPCDDQILPRTDSPLTRPVPGLVINGKRPGNRLVIHPMEGWDATESGGVTAEVRRRWTRFGESGAKLIFGGEAMAVRADGRANPRQLIIQEANLAGLAGLRETLVEAHRRLHGSTDDLVIGFQLTHSGRFCRPTAASPPEPRVAFRHPLLDARFGVTSDAQVFSDDELDRLVEDYVKAAGVAWRAGADFVDLKHCHGYLLHELLAAHTRPGRYGGSFENRTRFLRDTVAAIRAAGNPIAIAVRLSAFDLVPFIPDPATSRPGKTGTGVPAPFAGCLPYRLGFGVNEQNPLEPDLTETFRFTELCARLGITMLNLTAGSPYYNPHIQRPAAFPPSDGYQPPEDPLCGVARQINAVREIKTRCPAGLVVIGTGYSYLQEFLPLVAQAVVREGWTDLVGIGRMVLSYPGIFTDALSSGGLRRSLICRTLSDCTTAPRKGLISGCYPLDDYYRTKPEAAQLKAAKAPPGASPAP